MHGYTVPARLSEPYKASYCMLLQITPLGVGRGFMSACRAGNRLIKSMDIDLAVRAGDMFMSLIYSGASDSKRHAAT